MKVIIHSLRTYFVGFVTVCAFMVFGVTLAHALLYGTGVESGEVEVPQEELGLADKKDITTLVANSSGSVENNEPVEVVVADDRAPTRLVIPEIDVDARVQHVGLAYSGNMMPPSNYDDVGWYRYGVFPGEDGNAVIDGHVDDGIGLPAVFARLSRLDKRDKIFVTDAKGRKLEFVVTKVEVVERSQISSEELFSKTGEPQLILITCAGDWDQETRGYDERVIVTAKLKR